MKSFAAVLSGLLLVAASRPATAALTSSEKGQIASYVAEGRIATADRVRALVARPDLTSDESAEALSGAVVPLAFTDGRAAYLHELLYGSSSVPSRSVVAVAIARALSGRADAVMGRHEADLDQDPVAIDELSRLFAFLDLDVANAGQPRGAAHDPNAGIGASSYDDAAHALATVIANHPRWLKGDALIPAPAEPVRAQLQLTMLDMTNDTTTRRFDAADRLGLAGGRRTALTDLGLLLLDDGHTDAARVDGLRALLARMPGARDGVEAVALVNLKAPLRARGEVVTFNASSAPASANLFGADIAPPPFDPQLPPIAGALAAVTVRRALEARPDLRAIADKDAAAAAGDPAKTLGTPADASTSSVLASAVELLTIDAQSTVDLAMVGLLAGHPERSALLSDALGALATFAPPTPNGAVLALGRAADPSGTTTLTNVRVAVAGFVTAFTLGAHAFTLSRDDAGSIVAKRDGAPVTLAMLDAVRAPVSAGTVWSGGGLVFAKMAGSPRAGASAGGRVRVVGEGHGVDAIGTAAPGDDVAVEASVELASETAIVVRAIATPAGFKGIALVLDASASPLRASIRAWDDAGKLSELVAPVDVAPSARYVVRVAVRGAKLEARVGATTLRADVPAFLAHGDVAIAAKHGGSLEAKGWTVKRP
jgi:hypothetical protein